jgi:spore coat protein CotH
LKFAEILVLFLQSVDLHDYLRNMKSFFLFVLSTLISGYLVGQNKETLLESTNLPLIVINTNGQDIQDEPKITAEIKIIYNGQAALNHPDDPGNIYEGFCGIEYRGAYSQTLPQKPYGFETCTASGDNNNVVLLGMPSENDWILLANYNDKTFMRNTLAFHLFEKMGHYAPRARICEVMVNGEYMGIFILTEKIKRDNHRVDIAKLDEDDNAGDSLTGGYIFAVDYYDDSNSWLSNFSPIDEPAGQVHFVYKYPEPEKITAPQKNYIQSFVNSCESALYGDQFVDPVAGYRSFIDMGSYLDYFIIGELSRNADAYKKSAFFYKDRDNHGGLLKSGPVWDLDWAYKNMFDNCDIFAATDGSGWAYKVNECNDWPVAPAWTERLMQDSSFQDELFTRYTDLRETILSTEYLNNYIDSVHALVEEAQVRHYERWPILGINVGTPEVDEQPDTYDGEISKFKNWIETRLAWLDNNLPGEYLVSLPEVRISNSSIYRQFPNPAKDKLNIESNKIIRKIEFYNSTGILVYSSYYDGIYSTSIDVGRLKPGLYVTKVTFKNNETYVSKFIVQSTN